jgi:hypothetical protein
MENKYYLTLIGTDCSDDVFPGFRPDFKWTKAIAGLLESSSAISIVGKGVPTKEPHDGPDLPNSLKLTFDEDVQKNANLFKLLMQVERRFTMSILLTPVTGVTTEDPAIFLNTAIMGDYVTADVDKPEQGILDISFVEASTSYTVQQFATHVAIAKNTSPAVAVIHGKPEQ